MGKLSKAELRLVRQRWVCGFRAFDEGYGMFYGTGQLGPPSKPVKATPERKQAPKLST